MRSRSRRAFGLAILWLTAARAGSAQEIWSPAFDGLPPVLTRPELYLVDSLYAVLDPTASLEAAEALVRADSTDWDARWRAARAALALGISARRRSDQVTWYLRAEAHGERAVALDSLRVQGFYWLAASKGRRALREGPRATVDLAQQAWQLAQHVLALDPGHAGAHNILGRFNYEVASLGRVKRLLARILVGENDVMKSASWEEAERHGLASIEAAPFMILFHYDLARTYQRRDRRAEAKEQFREVLALPIRHPPDAGLQENARRLLARLEEQR